MHFGAILTRFEGLNPYEARIRQVISYAATAGLIILWSFPVAFVGIVANVAALAKYSWLSWINKIPGSVLGIIQGILPPLALAVLMMLLPIVLRGGSPSYFGWNERLIGLYLVLAHFEGIPRKTGIELSLMTRYFIFLVVVSPCGSFGVKRAHNKNSMVSLS